MLTRRVLLVRARSGVGLDIALGGLPFEESVVARSSLFAFPSHTLLRTCSAEDLLVLKAFAAAKDWLDVEGVIIRQTGKLDWSYIRGQLRLWPNSKKHPRSCKNLNGGVWNSNNRHPRSTTTCSYAEISGKENGGKENNTKQPTILHLALCNMTDYATMYVSQKSSR